MRVREGEREKERVGESERESTTEGECVICMNLSSVLAALTDSGACFSVSKRHLCRGGSPLTLILN